MAEFPGKQLPAPLELAARMEALAAEGDWTQIEVLSRQLREAVANVPPNERREILLAVQRSTDAIQSIASSARNEVKNQLSGLRRGRDATRAYGVTDRMAQLP